MLHSNIHDPLSNAQSKAVTLTFNSISDLSKFKNDCNCSDFYIDRDALTLVGTFTDEQLQIAFNKYSAVLKSQDAPE